jgi:hypothetical protein
LGLGFEPQREALERFAQANRIATVFGAPRTGLWIRKRESLCPTQPLPTPVAAGFGAHELVNDCLLVGRSHVLEKS